MKNIYLLSQSGMFKEMVFAIRGVDNVGDSSQQVEK